MNELAREWWDTLAAVTAAAYQDEDTEAHEAAHVEATRALIAKAALEGKKSVTGNTEVVWPLDIAADFLPDEEG
jgi:hypothetical protein